MSVIFRFLFLIPVLFHLGLLIAIINLTRVFKHYVVYFFYFEDCEIELRKLSDFPKVIQLAYLRVDTNAHLLNLGSVFLHLMFVENILTKVLRMYFN